MFLNNVFKKQLLQCCRQNVYIQQQRNIVGWLMYSAKKGVSRDLITFLQQPIDLSPEGIQQWITRKKWNALTDHYGFDGDKHSTLGPDLAVAHFIVERGGAVKFVNSFQWIQKDANGKYRLPNRRLATFLLEAIDASNTELMYISFDNFVGLKHLQYLNLTNCKHIDDWCIDRLQLLKRSLVHLDVSGCPHVTERGLAALHKMNLRCLDAHNMAHIPQPGLLKLMLEEMMPACTVEGLGSLEQEAVPKLPEVQQSLHKASQ